MGFSFREKVQAFCFFRVGISLVVKFLLINKQEKKFEIFRGTCFPCLCGNEEEVAV